MRRSRRRPVTDPKRLEEYDFYPFVVAPGDRVVFDLDRFNVAVEEFVRERNERAAGELIIIGEQNLVREVLPSGRLRRYKELFTAYDGNALIRDNERFLANYKRIVDDIGRSFPDTGVEILLHNLVNPSQSMVAIRNAAVTGRSIGSGATNLVLDLKTRRQRGEDKVNYELNIGARRFKCTTIPIYREDFGLVGAVCINIDINFLREAVRPNGDRLDVFFDNFLRTDFELDENILSEDEYRNALKGKRHYMDESIRSVGSQSIERKLAAIFFSDVVGFTSLLESDEAETLGILRTNEAIHREALASHSGQWIKGLGDGVLASFQSASNAVAAAQEIQRRVTEDGRYQVRIGIHLGEVVTDDGDVFGDGVNIAARVQSEMEPGAIGITQVVYDNVKNKGVSAVSLGERMLKNMSGGLVVYAVLDPASAS